MKKKKVYRVWFRGENGKSAYDNEAFFTDKKAAVEFAEKNNGTMNVFRWAIKVYRWAIEE